MSIEHHEALLKVLRMQWRLLAIKDERRQNQVAQLLLEDAFEHREQQIFAQREEIFAKAAVEERRRREKRKMAKKLMKAEGGRASRDATRDAQHAHGIQADDSSKTADAEPAVQDAGADEATEGPAKTKALKNHNVDAVEAGVNDEPEQEPQKAKKTKVVVKSKADQKKLVNANNDKKVAMKTKKKDVGDAVKGTNNGEIKQRKAKPEVRAVVDDSEVEIEFQKKTKPKKASKGKNIVEREVKAQSSKAAKKKSDVKSDQQNEEPIQKEIATAAKHLKTADEGKKTTKLVTAEGDANSVKSGAVAKNDKPVRRMRGAKANAKALMAQHMDDEDELLQMVSQDYESDSDHTHNTMLPSFSPLRPAKSRTSAMMKNDEPVVEDTAGPNASAIDVAPAGVSRWRPDEDDPRIELEVFPSPMPARAKTFSTKKSTSLGKMLDKAASDDTSHDMSTEPEAPQASKTKARTSRAEATKPSGTSAANDEAAMTVQSKSSKASKKVSKNVENKPKPIEMSSVDDSSNLDANTRMSAKGENHALENPVLSTPTPRVPKKKTKAAVKAKQAEFQQILRAGSDTQSQDPPTSSTDVGVENATVTVGKKRGRKEMEATSQKPKQQGSKKPKTKMVVKARKREPEEEPATGEYDRSEHVQRHNVLSKKSSNEKYVSSFSTPAADKKRKRRDDNDLKTPKERIPEALKRKKNSSMSTANGAIKSTNGHAPTSTMMVPAAKQNPRSKKSSTSNAANLFSNKATANSAMAFGVPSTSAMGLSFFDEFVNSSKPSIPRLKPPTAQDEGDDEG